VIEYGAFKVLMTLMTSLPHGFTSRAGASVAALFGEFGRWLGARGHRQAVRNLEMAFPDLSPAERDGIRRGMWRNWGRFIADFGRFGYLSHDRLRELITLDPPHIAPEIAERAKKRGALVLTAHYGSFEMLHAGVAAYGYPVTIVHRRFTNELFDRWIVKMRGNVGTRSLARGEAARDLVDALRAGQIVAIPFDQIAKKSAQTFAPFFGVPASTNNGLARLALVTGAPVYPVVIAREGDTLRHRALFGPEIPVERTGDRQHDLLVNTRRFNEVLEALIRKHPDHWIWMYGRWKRQPDGLVSPYLRNAPPLAVYRAAAAATTG